MAEHRDGLAFLGMPGYGELTAGAARGFWRATRRPDSRVYRQYNEGSLLASNFNSLWCGALNLCHRGEPVRYFAMQHADIEPQDWWLDTLIEEMEVRGLDLLGVAVAIKDQKGLTSTALARPDGNNWRIHCRLTMTEIYNRLPETFTSDDVGHPLLLNTGLWVCRFDEAWAKKVRFTINDRITFNPRLDRYVPETEPEDWYFSRLCHELGLKIGCTRKIAVEHRGGMSFPNDRPWGEPFDAAYVDASVLPDSDRDGFRFPSEVDGWLTYREGKGLADLARGKRVLEIGSYCGRSTVCLAQTAESVVAVDTFDGRGTPTARDTREAFWDSLRRHEVAHKVTAWIGEASEQLPGRADRFDLIFLDGSHDADAVRSDITLAVELLTPGGLIAFHDYREMQHPGVAEAVDELIAAGGEMVSVHDTLAVVRPPAAVPVEV